ncbi:HNH endonuclease [Halomonas denitrificans]|nr:HNH endonuclease [Halomonas denitrificans]
MLHDPKALGPVLSLETGLGLEANSRKDIDGRQIISLTPEGYNPAHTFAIEVAIEWRRLELSFVPGKFAGPLLQAMSEADASGRAVFKAVLEDCEELGAKIIVSPNGMEHRFNDVDLWNATWRRLSFQLSKGSLELGAEDGIQDFEIVQQWATRFAAAVVSLLPLEEHEAEELEGFPEGAVQMVEVNRYERDRRNRAAALAIHGSACLACGMDFGRTYGPDADGYIEVHHVVPVSLLGPDYVIDPKEDLVPLCPNCHAVAHRRNPPFSVAEIKKLLASGC